MGVGEVRPVWAVGRGAGQAEALGAGVLTQFAFPAFPLVGDGFGFAPVVAYGVTLGYAYGSALFTRLFDHCLLTEQVLHKIVSCLECACHQAYYG